MIANGLPPKLDMLLLAVAVLLSAARAVVDLLSSEGLLPVALSFADTFTEGVPFLLFLWQKADRPPEDQ